MNNTYDLTEIPEGVVKRMDVDCDQFYEDNKDNIKWSGNIEIPELGTKVNVNFNSLRTGVVSNYFIEDGWLGVKVVLDKRPDWHVKQNPNRNHALAFGVEIEIKE